LDFALTILGVNAATPAHGRYPTSQYLQIHNHHFLIDCGEGTQMRLSDFGLSRGKINHIFISHLHGDHIFGLPGLLFSFALNDRSNPLHIYSPNGLEEMVMAQLMPSGEMPFPLIFHSFSTDTSTQIFENGELTVHTIPLRHRIPTCGFLFSEKPFQKNINPEKIKKYGLTVPQIVLAKNGNDVELTNGTKIKNHDLTYPPFKPRSYAFASDTMYHEAMIPNIMGVDLLYHETTFCNDAKERAIATMHSTAEQAAMIAKMANAGTLVTGHYSSRYIEIDIFLNEATAIFPNTVLGKEGNKYVVERKREIDDVK
jgi:ribonuclease Z